MPGPRALEWRPKGGQDVAETPEQLVAHLESVSSEDVRAQLTALRRVAAVRNEDPARLRQDGRLQRCLGRLEIRDVDARGFADLAWSCARLAVQDGPLVRSLSRTCVELSP